MGDLIGLSDFLYVQVLPKLCKIHKEETINHKTIKYIDITIP